MLVGHLAAGLAGKLASPKTSLGTLVLAALAADLLWCVFLLVGLEHVTVTERGATLMRSVVVSDISYSHSLLMNVLWGTILSAFYFWRRRDDIGAWVVFGVLISHWLLDVISHHPDMPIAPRGKEVFGLGLWNSIPATLLIEGGLWLLAVLLYARTKLWKTRPRLILFWIGILLLTAAWYNNIAGPPPPPNVAAAAVSSLIIFSLTVVWAWWIDRQSKMETNC
jgi:hypothetical protein